MVMNTLGDTLAKTEVKTLRDRKTKRIENLKSWRHSTQVESVFNALADSLVEINGKTLEDKLLHVQEEALVDTVAYRIALLL